MWGRRALLAAGLCALGGCVTSQAHRLEPQRRPAAGVLPPPSSPLTVVSWNIGYAGLGEESDFIAEGGRRLRAPNRAIVEKNVEGVAAHLRALAPDIVLMQELAGPGLLTRNVDVAGRLSAALPDYSFTFSPDVDSRLRPGAVALRHGLGLFTRVATSEPRAIDLPDEPHALAYVVARNYHALAIDLDVADRPWTLINVHLAAYEQTGVRERQLRAVLDYAERLHADGRTVVVGGDYNLMLRDVAFDGPGPERDARRFPRDMLAVGWSLLADAGAPTIRSKEAPYRPGSNRLSIIDGFIVCPRVETLELRTLDLGFRFTDHQPVLARFG
jgi:endonuclease/exonuclease/phosphatase family metal-dependent hydrolase